MKITYIHHSSFLMEWDNCYWLFDYFKGQIPVLCPEKELFVFISHAHGDHYNKEIFQLFKEQQQVTYILSSDIRLTEKEVSEIKSQKSTKDLFFVKGDIVPILMEGNNEIRLKVLRSTDQGVAFLLKYMGKTIYHAGDLHLWIWRGETKGFNNNMRANFLKYSESLKGMNIDIGFLVLDPRQEDWYAQGMLEYLSLAEFETVFPMHFWEKPEIMDLFMKEHGKEIRSEIKKVNYSGETWTFEYFS